MARKQKVKPDVDISKLCMAIRSSRHVLEPFRRVRTELTSRFAGPNWSTETAKRRRPVNFLSLYLTMTAGNLVSQNPQVNLSTKKRQNNSVVTTMKDWVNPHLAEQDFGDELERWVYDALMLIGIMKVGIADPGAADLSGHEMRTGLPYATTVDFDDFVFDTHARKMNQAAFVGHRLRVPLWVMKDTDIYNKKLSERARATEDIKINETGEERISTLQRQWISGDYEEAYEHCDVWEIYLPREKKLVTLLSDDGGLPYGSENEDCYDCKPYVGPYCGPYHYLQYIRVPGQAIGKGPAMDILDLDFHFAGLMQKLMDQASRQRNVVAYTAAGESDASRLMKARDGQFVRVDSIANVTPLTIEGANAGNQAFALGIWDFLNKLGGNIELLGGLSAQSKTATQDKMLNANSSRSMMNLQSKTVQGTSKVARSLLWFYHHHPEMEMTGYRPVTGLSQPYPRTVTPADRQQVPFEDLDIQVEPYSLQSQTPQERLAFMTQTVTQILMPIMPLLQQQGVYFDVAKYVQYIAQYGNAPDLNEVIRTGTPNVNTAPEEDAATKPATSERTYNRVSSSEATDPGQTKAVQQALMGQNAGGRMESGNFGGAA